MVVVPSEKRLALALRLVRRGIEEDDDQRAVHLEHGADALDRHPVQTRCGDHALADGEICAAHGVSPPVRLARFLGGNLHFEAGHEVANQVLNLLRQRVRAVLDVERSQACHV
jgi:hypothetical protein